MFATLRRVILRYLLADECCDHLHLSAVLLGAVAVYAICCAQNEATNCGTSCCQLSGTPSLSHQPAKTRCTFI
jgi:hypothetical protein